MEITDSSRHPLVSPPHSPLPAQRSERLLLALVKCTIWLHGAHQVELPAISGISRSNYMQIQQLQKSESRATNDNVQNNNNNSKNNNNNEWERRVKGFVLTYDIKTICRRTLSRSYPIWSLIYCALCLWPSRTLRTRRTTNVTRATDAAPLSGETRKNGRLP